MVSVQTLAVAAIAAGLAAAACGGVAACVREEDPRPSATPSPSLHASPGVSSSARPGRRCTERACVDQTSVSSAAGLVRVVGIAGGKETTFECTTQGDGFGTVPPPSLDPSCEGTSLTVPLVFDSLRVTTRTGTVLVTPTYETTYANGPGCPGTCQVARVTIP